MSSTAVFVLGSLSSSYILFLTGASCYVLIQSTLAYDHCSVQQGVSLSVIPVAPLLTWALNDPSFDFPVVAMVGIADIGILFVVGGFAAARYRYHLFTATPAIGTLGEDSLITETDDLMFVVDNKERVATSNRTAAETLDVKQGDMRGSSIKDISGYSLSELSDAETVSLTTTDSTRQYDSQVSTVTDPYANQLGAVISLRDVTDREFRQQQLAVLNRVLRHNIRNRVDVAKSHAEALPDDTNSHRAAIISTVDNIVSLSNQARQIDQYIANGNTIESASIPTVITNTLSTIDTNGLSISTDMPDSAMVTTNRDALVAATESALSNAVDYASSTVSITVTAVEMGYQIEISDDGPGIPAAELDSLDTGVETQLQHTTGLGLWQIKWAVQTIGGNVTFDTESGTTVTLTIPDDTIDK
ncbi:sensor histidine kinase [Halorubrum sp. BOL3-1]|uniref:sensor histidine kinase n=1 Tax=Halorubrum sp. BOL3-1 TaxID=2497325 RepID=UPI00140E3F6D|nr:HAMP domain-containing sensor histidine kinase [Halorubrum sp. BOL3-1]